MEFQPSVQDQHHGLGSWHPAMRPNAQEHTYSIEGQLAKTIPYSKASDDIARRNTASYQLPFRLKSSPQDQLLTNPSPSNLQSTQPTLDSRVTAEENMSVLVTDTDRFPHHDRQEIANGDRSVGPTTDRSDAEKISTNMAKSSHGEGDSLEGSAQDIVQGPASILELGGRNHPPPSAASGFSGSAVGDPAEMDRAWELKEQNISPDKAVHISHTNSFPAVPTTQHTMPPDSLPHSHVGVIMEGDESADSSSHDIASSSKAQNSHSSNDAFPSVADEEDESFFDHLQSTEGAVMIGEADEETRFEEGLPLIPTSESGFTGSYEDQNGHTKAESPNAMGEEDDFDQVPAGLPEDVPAFKPRPLDRKSTTQVLDSIHYPPHSVTHTESEEQSSLANMTGGGIAVSAHTIKSQVLTEQNMDASESKPMDEGLAEMWKAALGDDDLLEENEESVDPSAFFEDDGEGFLGEDQVQTEKRQSQMAMSPDLEPIYAPDGKMQGFGETKFGQVAPQDKYLPATATESQPSLYSQSAHPTSVPNHIAPAPVGTAGSVRQPSHSVQAATRPQMPISTQSFANKSKGGYTSPYDLPMDVTRPKKRTTYQQMHPSPEAQQPSSRPPPPRSSSMFTGAPQTVDSRSPVPRLPSAYSPAQAGHALPPALKASPSLGNFFEELPSTKSRPSSSMGRYVPPASQPVSTPPIPSQLEPPRQSSLPRLPSSNAVKTPQQFELLPPERISLYGNSGQGEPDSRSVPAMSARHSPAPTQSSNVPPPRNRYVASPSRPPSSQILPFQPRTSSPLAQNHIQPQQSQQGPASDPTLRRPESSGQQSHTQDSVTPSYPFSRHLGLQNKAPTDLQGQSDGGTTKLSEWRPSPLPFPGPQQTQLSTSASDSSYAMNTPDPEQLSSDGSSSVPQNNEVPSFGSDIPSRVPPRRSQTQSPGAGRYAPQSAGAQVPSQRPASVINQTSTPFFEGAMPSGNHVRPRGRTLSKDLSYLRPTDGRELDPLERWKGCPIFVFGFGGAIVTSFPKQIPRYATGQAVPMVKCSPGEVRLQDGKILPIEEDIATFPGPLKSKGKKKDVVDWLQKRISRLENEIDAFAGSSTLPDLSKRHEEKIILWKIVRTMIEHDGMLDNNPSAEKTVRSMLSPELTRGDSATLPDHISTASILSIKRRNGSQAIPGPTDPAAMEDLRKILLHGEREKAVWHAVDNRFWAHAMLLSSTLDQNTWKQVSQEFVRQEVKTYGENTEALAALYQIFAGNWEESADELVPPSARAGLQMVSKTSNTGPTKNAVEGLDRWRETLTLILSNRTSDDSKALVSLGQLLAGYGRTEAAHICYIFAKLPNIFGGPDDPQVKITLLGADHFQHPFEHGRDLDSILLTEVFEFGRTVLSSSSVATVSPHLQSFKLYHAMILAQYGYKSEAQQYSEIISSTVNSTTKRSPYYHPLFLEALNSLMERLRQAPSDSSGSWISKPSIDKVSGSIWAKFNQYVAGDESDATSIASGKGHDTVTGPFAGMTSDSPSLSRTPSSNDLYNSYTPGTSVVPTITSSSTRYAPAGLYTPRSSLEQQGRPIQDPQRPQPTDSLRPAVSQQHYQSRPNSSASSYHDSYQPVALSSSHPAPTQSYLPTPPSQPQYMPSAPPDDLQSSLYQHESDGSASLLEPQALRETGQPQPDPPSTNGYQPFSSSSDHADRSAYQPSSKNHYEPPALSTYDPPSYNDGIPLVEGLPTGEKLKKKSYMDDDEEDDFEARAAAIRREEKARKDREADETFRRAAEADAQKDKAPKLNSKKSGWFGGWLGGKKPEGEDAHGTPNAPIKAKLGEQSSFYYDSEQKRWINKKDPDATPAVKAPPPPPKGPSRAISTSGPPPPSTTGVPPVPPLPPAAATPPITFTKPPTSDSPLSNVPSQHPSRTASPAVNSTVGSLPEAGASGASLGPPSAPPSRPATSMSNASSIDDLIGAPQARKGGTIRKGKKKGYVDVMAK